MPKPRAIPLLVLLAACGGEDPGDTGNVDYGTATDGTTAGVACDVDVDTYNDDESVQLPSTYAWSCDDTERTLTANGVPDHEVGTFPNAGDPNPLTEQSVSASFPLAPELADASTQVHPTGYALNGVKFDPGTAGTCDDSGSDCVMVGGTGDWSIEALGQSAFDFGTDENNAHTQPDGSYHYHGMPERYLDQLGDGSQMILVGWALDGFPMYARYGYSDPLDASSPLVVLTSSYALKSTPDAGRPSTDIYAMGTFTQDYAYVDGSGDLDECNGRFGVTPEFPDGTYYYAVTDTWPYAGRCVNGVVSADAGGPPGGGPPAGGPP